jgi:hypothetical protein
MIAEFALEQNVYKGEFRFGGISHKGGGRLPDIEAYRHHEG